MFDKFDVSEPMWKYETERRGKLTDIDIRHSVDDSEQAITVTCVLSRDVLLIAVS